MIRAALLILGVATTYCHSQSAGHGESNQTTTQSECPEFCNVAPTESAHLVGPFTGMQTNLLFSGNCVAEYVMDWDKKKLQLQTRPTSIASYFGSPGGASLPAPVTLAFMTLNSSDSTGFDAFFQSQSHEMSIRCDTGSEATKSDVCPRTADSTGVIPTSVATSASSQLDFSTGTNIVNQYVVDSNLTNIKLMDASFNTTYQTSTGFLDGQSKIAKITAIQVTFDASGPHGTILTVFGAGVDNVTPYVGFVQMDLQGIPSISLTPRTWISEPVPLKTGINNCDVSSKLHVPGTL